MPARGVPKKAQLAPTLRHPSRSKKLRDFLN
jgi:hypothetical protein